MNSLEKMDSAGPASILALIARAAENPAVNVATMEALFKMHRELAAEQALVAFNEAMNLAQAEIQPVARTTENTQTKSFYAKLEEVDAAIRPIYLRHGFSLSYNTVAPLTQAFIRVECRCAHSAGHVERFYREAPADTLGPKGSAVKTVLHGEGSTETFLKRYLACGIFNVVFRNQDDDGNRGGTYYLDGESIAEIEALITDTKSDKVRFLQYMGVDSVGEIQLKDKAAAINALMNKRRRASADTPPSGAGAAVVPPAVPASSQVPERAEAEADARLRASGGSSAPRTRGGLRENAENAAEAGGSPATSQELSDGASGRGERAADVLCLAPVQSSEGSAATDAPRGSDNDPPPAGGEAARARGGRREPVADAATHGSPELDADAAKLVAMGADPGPTFVEIDAAETEDALGETGIAADLGRRLAKAASKGLKYFDWYWINFIPPEERALASPMCGHYREIAQKAGG